MKKILRLHNLGVTYLQKLAFLMPLITRITLGVLFFRAGWGKLTNLDRVIGFFSKLEIPNPEVLAPTVAFFEFSCGLLILFGLFTRAATLPLIVIMKVALLTAKKSQIHAIPDLFGISDFLYIVLLGWILFEGAGKISLDHWLSKLVKKKR